MTLRRTVAVVGMFLLSGCSVTHYKSLDETPQMDILVSSNVKAEIWMDGQKIQEAEKEHVLTQTGMAVLTLKAPGMNDAQLIVYRNLPEKKNVTAHQSSVPWTTQKSGDLTLDVSDLGNDSVTTGPTSTLMLPINLVKFVVDLVGLPFSYTTEFNPLGYYIAYDKNQFYVEMTPLGSSGLTAFDAFKMQVKVFVLKNYPELAKGNQEYIAALSRFSGLKITQINQALLAVTPAEAAEEVVRCMKPVK